MQEDNLSILRSLKLNLEELLPPLDASQKEIYGEDKENIRDSLDLIMGELTMMVVMLTNIDSNISAAELKLINDMRHVVFGYLESQNLPQMIMWDYFGNF